MNLFMSTNWESPDDLVKQLLLHCDKSASASVHYEIERKWLATPSTVDWFMQEGRATRPPNEPGKFKIRYINSVWISTDPEIRVRAYYSENHRLEIYKICYKGNAEQNGMKRPEAESECTEEVYLKAIELASKDAHPYRGSLIMPMKFWIWTPYYGPTYELKSMDYGAQYQLEVEAKSIEEVEKLVLPLELNKTIECDVTNIKKYMLKNYWQRTRMR